MILSDTQIDVTLKYQNIRAPVPVRRPRLPQFPRFTKLRPDNLVDVRLFTRKLREYSDFNTVSLVAWDINNDTQLSTMHGNLVVIFTDYINKSQFISIHGTHKIAACISKILNFSAQLQLEPQLKLIPEETAHKVQHLKRYAVTPDRDNYDYIVSLREFAALAGNRFEKARWQVNTFVKKHLDNTEYVELDLNNDSHVTEMLEVFKTREAMKPTNDERLELEAIKRLIDHHTLFDLVVRGVRIDNVLQAFIILEKSEGQLVGHFWKANTMFNGVYLYLFRTCCQEFVNRGYETINVEQDLGIAELRKAKKLMQGTYLKKYSIERAPTPLPTVQAPVLQPSSLVAPSR